MTFPLTTPSGWCLRILVWLAFPNRDSNALSKQLNNAERLAFEFITKLRSSSIPTIR